ncbi:hypothetical protein [Maribacter polysaccharolyticus]|uniref:hypothetical protein n=1 Tax=Maribacter polysaccharolyticus TaxID=3020831 RepID=UPI00237FCB07|nr:hypothetical protein [Maribacter polysaccharolyticus]MDE3743070.1 hypothetical protein [Maribacter polysaccharolyticus]
MKKSTLNISISVIYYCFIILIVLSQSGDILWMDECKFHTLSVTTWYQSIWAWVLMAFLGFIYVKILKIKYLPLRYYFLLPLITILYTGPIYRKNLNSRIESKPNIIEKAVIYDIALGQRTHACSFSFEFNGKEAKSIKSTKIKYLKKLNIGDTILIKVSKDCKYMNKIHNLFPNKSEMDLYK